jgi:UTP--glucose-1-phosphate uridylyltransferase
VDVGFLKAVIPAAGLGTRLLSATKEQPKEMLPLFALSIEGQLCLKPIIQLVFEQLYDRGVREFCFIVGKSKRAIEDHFTIDMGYLEHLNSKGKNCLASDLQDFYRKVEESTIMWVNQPQPKGFGHAILQARSFAGDSSILVHAGDTFIVSTDGGDYLERLVGLHRKNNQVATLLLKEVPDPRPYGVAEVVSKSEGLKVISLVEKPEKPATNLAVMPLYIFESVILDALKELAPGYGGEIQLTDAIQRLIAQGLDVGAILLNDVLCLDIGTPESYWEALRLSYTYITTSDNYQKV